MQTFGQRLINAAKLNIATYEEVEADRSAMPYIIGTKLLAEPRTKADLGQMLRIIGFAAAPGMLRVVGVVPAIGGLLVAAVEVWMLAAMVVAVRQALDYTSTGRALAVCLVGFLVLVATSIVLGGIVLFGS